MPSTYTATALPNISSLAWEHPADRTALQALRKVPGFDKVIQMVFGATTERSLRLLYLGSSVRASSKQFGRAHELLVEACRVFDVQQRPELFIMQNPLLNAGAVGMDNPFIVLNSSMVESFDEAELLTVIGHELGHILSGHVLYKTVANLIFLLSQRAIRFPLSDIVLMGVVMALQEWQRKSELSCDRAGLLAAQNPDVSIRVLMKLAGGGNVEQMDLGEFLAQAEEYERSEEIADTVFKLFNTLDKTHPFAVVRAAELIKWIRSGEYDAILSGDYLKRNESQSYSFREDFARTQEAYGQDFKKATEPLQNFGQDLSQQAKDFLGNIFKR
ncbi:M48 family metallopeptidase [Hugenholtzia roseola]|uniref:M48 family metallopeptidase n=1 Tax=Hugenholtzia roseola TaxID=1002 RepID=UPI0004113CD5|nr:M48 family metallopeptidase [Hugenholtzia roseola]